MIKISGIKINTEEIHDEKASISEAVSDFFSVPVNDFSLVKILKKSLDARKKPLLFYTYSVVIKAENENVFFRKNHGSTLHVEKFLDSPYVPPRTEKLLSEKRPIVIGSGPAGLFAAYVLALSGLKPIVFERGASIEKRTEETEKFFKTNVLNERTNVCFGEGGAGTFSDGKLFTGSKDRDGKQHFVLETFHKFGAFENILYDAKPHIGTDALRRVISNMRDGIISLGGEFYFETKVEKILFEKATGGIVCGASDSAETLGNSGFLSSAECPRKAVGIETEGGEKFYSDHIVLAIGHSARDTILGLLDDGVEITAKPFAIGLRVEHPQDFIDFSQYGKHREGLLPAADYKLTYTSTSGRGVYSFCMCPGGFVVNSSAEKGKLTVNGMSYNARDSKNANSAIIVSVGEKDFGTDAIKAMAFQDRLEKKAYALAGGFIPQQLFKDFCKKRDTHEYGAFDSVTKGQVKFARLDTLFPQEIYASFIEGMRYFDKKIRGFADGDAILSGVESRTSSPVRIVRSPETFLAEGISGLYPAGEGAGYAGGIMSSAVDGIRAAEHIIAD